MHIRKNRLAILLYLLIFLTAVGCTPESIDVGPPPQDSQQNDAPASNENTDSNGAPGQNNGSDDADQNGVSVPPEDPATDEESGPTEVTFTDELDDVRSLMSGDLTEGWGPGLDIGGVVISLDPATGDVVFKLSLPGVEDFDAFIQSNPNWGFIIAGDGDPEGTPACKTARMNQVLMSWSAAGYSQ